MFEKGQVIAEAKINPKYLHSNSTSHTWPFGALAELIDNAHDALAKNVHIEYKEFQSDQKNELSQQFNYEQLIVQDDGTGLTPKGLLHMMSFGYCEKSSDIKDPIGMYGNGFKSGSMRFGKDVVVFTKNENTSSVGMLSQSYLEQIGADTIQVPIAVVTPDANPDHNLEQITKYSPFDSREKIEHEFSQIKSAGTRIIIYNHTEKSLSKEFDFQKEDDILLLDQESFNTNAMERPKELYSLRSYLEILYLTPRMKLHLRGKRVEARLMLAEILLPYRCSYQPRDTPGSGAEMTLGYSPSHLKRSFGMMVYHKERLVKIYEPLPAQKRGQFLHNIGVIKTEIKPNHSKQDFDPTPLRRVLDAANKKLKEYCRRTSPGAMSKMREILDAMSEHQTYWSQCNECLKWRKTQQRHSEWVCVMDENCSCEDQQEEFSAMSFEEIETEFSKWISEDIQDEDYVPSPQGSVRKRKPEGTTTPPDSGTPSPSKKPVQLSPEPVPRIRLEPRKLYSDTDSGYLPDSGANTGEARSSHDELPPLVDNSMPPVGSTVPSQVVLGAEPHSQDKLVVNHFATPASTNDSACINSPCNNSNTNNTKTTTTNFEEAIKIESQSQNALDDFSLTPKSQKIIDLDPDEVVLFISQWAKDPEVTRVLPEHALEQVADQMKRIYQRNKHEQKKLREELKSLYGKRCLVTGWSHEAVYEAAHIIPVSQCGQTFDPTNGILLRRDFHTLFDRHVWTLKITDGGANASVFYAKGLEDVIVQEFEKRLWWEHIQMMAEAVESNFEKHNKQFFEKRTDHCEIKAIP